MKKPSTVASSSSPRPTVKAGVRIKSGVKAGQEPEQMGIKYQHNVTQLRIKSGVKAGGNGGWGNHNVTQIRIERAAGIRVA